tara:strand:- start:130 stop:249 length:120 start_codon:yes stop_codon:yes gene_type:complete
MLNFELPIEDVEYLLSLLDEWDEDFASRIREEITLQAYE